MPQRRHLQKSQYGQGMVEYAILLILTVTLVIGGIELASAALASGKASDAAKAGAGDLAAINETRLKAQENQQKYLRQLDNLYNAGVHQVDAVGLLAASVAQDDEVGAGPAIYDDYVKFLDSFAMEAVDDLVDGDTLTTDLTEAYLDFFDETAPATLRTNLLGGYTALEEIFDKIDGLTDDDNSGIVDDADKDEEIVLAELIQAIENTTEIDTDNDGDVDERFNLVTAVVNLSPTTLAEKTARLKTLMLIEEMRLSMLPLDPRVALSESTPLIGNHIPDYNAATPEFDRPSCTVEALSGETTYNTGFPFALDDDNNPINITSVDLDGDGARVIDTPAVYLFNPLPIDVATCQGNDATRGGRSRISILMGGYVDNNNPENNFSGLPKLNQAFYGQYTRVCLDNSNRYTACGGANVAQELMKPPGKYCLNTVATAAVDSCPGLDDEHIETSGYYFWGYAGAGDPDIPAEKFKWIYRETDPPPFRPTMQLTCNDESDRELISSDSCDSTLVPDIVKTVRVEVRYRSIFESFLTFGLMELTNPNSVANLADYFYDPSNLRSLGNGNIGVSVVGSELGPKSSNKNPSVKQHKDFRGCYDINLETNSVTSCN